MKDANEKNSSWKRLPQTARKFLVEPLAAASALRGRGARHELLGLTPSRSNDSREGRRIPRAGCGGREGSVLGISGYSC